MQFNEQQKQFIIVYGKKIGIEYHMVLLVSAFAVLPMFWL